MTAGGPFWDPVLPIIVGRRRSRSRVVQTFIGVAVAVALVFGLGWVVFASPRVTCGCPGEFPLGAYFGLGPVQLGKVPTILLVSLNSTPYPPPLPPVGVPLSALSFQVFDPHSVAIPIQSVCVVSSQGTLKGIWSGSAGAWDQGSPTPSTPCTSAGGPTGNAPPGNNTLANSDVVYFVLGAPIASGSSVGISAHGSGLTGTVTRTYYVAPTGGRA
ncbi:MAG TPA: hypothetical protein VFF67_05290 [Thermoplasmata archaeon]|nr:hypothetical protein [Thermoplasmata archaeon]